MSRQSSIESYFKAKGSLPKSSQTLSCKDMSDMKVKRRNLSIIKSRTPSKSPKKSEENKAVDGIINFSSDNDSESPIKSGENKAVDDVINLCSDDEDVFEISNLRTSTVNLSQGTTSSNDTLLYSVSPETPKKTLPLRTPQKTPQSSSTSQSSQATKLKGTSSPKKFFSPTKNRTVVKRSSKVKRSLSMEMANLAELVEDEIFGNACKDMDDKSE